METDGFLIPALPARTTIEVQRSRFITDVFHADDANKAKESLMAIRREFPDANHHCWAYQLGPPGDTRMIGMSDDGEPHGTAGRPMLNCLIHSEFGEIVAVVTRYFGGTKLGKGGLVRAYTQAVNTGLQALKTKVKIERETLSFSFEYAHLGAIEMLMEETNVVVESKVFSERVSISAQVPRLTRSEFEAQLVNLTFDQVVFS